VSSFEATVLAAGPNLKIALNRAQAIRIALLGNDLSAPRNSSIGTDRPVGVSQLLEAIDKIGTLPKGNLPEWLRGAIKLVSVIITKDEIGSSWMMNAYLNARFQEKLNRNKYKKLKITPLVSMNVSSLERAV
jgi:hypothetical protein